MRLKNILIVVKDIEKAEKFYSEIFGFRRVLFNEGNLMLTDGLVLQQADIWKEAIGKDVYERSNSSELYFEEKDFDGFREKLDRLYPDTVYVTGPVENSWGRKIIRFYDPDGNLIEVSRAEDRE